MDTSFLDELIKTSLAADADAWFKVLIWSTAVLFLGVVFEEIPFEGLPFTNRLNANMIDLRRAQLVPRRGVTAIKSAYKWIALLMVFGGIAGEGIAEYVAARYEGLLRDFDGILVAATQLEAAQADERARNGESANAALRQQLKTEGDKAREKEAELTRNNLQTEQQLESEARERLELQKRVAPRSLTLDDQRALSRLCKPFAAGLLFRRVSVGSYAMDAEAANLGSQIIASLENAGISTENQLSTVQSLGGFELGMEIKGLATDKLFVGTIGQFLGDKTGSPVRWSWGPSPKNKLSAVTIWIGVKPVPIIPTTAPK